MSGRAHSGGDGKGVGECDCSDDKGVSKQESKGGKRWTYSILP
jgi:hypothetical protein